MPIQQRMVEQNTVYECSEIYFTIRKTKGMFQSTWENLYEVNRSSSTVFSVAPTLKDLRILICSMTSHDSKEPVMKNATYPWQRPDGLKMQNEGFIFGLSEYRKLFCFTVDIGYKSGDFFPLSLPFPSWRKCGKKRQQMLLHWKHLIKKKKNQSLKTIQIISLLERDPSNTRFQTILQSSNHQN